MEESRRKFRYLTIYEDIKAKIESGLFVQGEKLKTEKDYQDEYGVSRDTVRKALSRLESEDYIVRKTAVGTFVKYKKSNYELSRMKSFTEQMRSRSIMPSSELVSIELLDVLTQHVRKELDIDEAEKCYRITRIRKGDHIPMAYEIANIPQKLCPNLQKYIDDQSSLYETYEKIYHHKLGKARMKLEAECPTPLVQESLKLSHDSPVLKMECTMELEDGRPLYYVECYYVGERYFFSAILPR